MGVGGFGIHFGIQVACGRPTRSLVYSDVQEVDRVVVICIRQFDGGVVGVKDMEVLVKRFPAVGPEDEDIIQETKVEGGGMLDLSMGRGFPVGHKNVSVLRGIGVSHGCAFYLQIRLTVKVKCILG